MTKKKFKPRKFFIKCADGYTKCVSVKFLRSLSRNEAFNISIATLSEMQRQLSEDMFYGGELCINTIPLALGYERSLNELNNIFPNLFDQIKFYERRIDGLRISVA